MHWIFRFWLWLGLLATAPGLVVAQEVAASVGDGLLGTYYQGRNFEQFRHRQVDASIDFHLRRQSLVGAVYCTVYLRHSLPSES